MRKHVSFHPCHQFGNIVEAPRPVVIGEGRELVVGDWWPQERLGVEPSLHHLGRKPRSHSAGRIFEAFPYSGRY